MEIIEKTCPGCGAGLEFNENSKSCRCEYCHRTFGIKRDSTSNINDISEQFDLSEVKGFKKLFIGQSIIISIFAIIIFISLFCGFAYSITYEVSKNSLVTDISEFDTKNYSTIDSKVNMAINNLDKSISVHELGSPKRVQVYLANKKDSNYLIPIYKIKFENFFDNNYTCEVYMPFKFENVNNDDFDLFDVSTETFDDMPKVSLSKDDSVYVHGYENEDDAYNAVVKPLEKDYKITKKEN